MAKTTKSQALTRKFLVRIPIEREPELVEASAELGIDPTNFIRMQTMKALNERKRVEP